jgi:hypothetical protein
MSGGKKGLTEVSRNRDEEQTLANCKAEKSR